MLLSISSLIRFPISPGHFSFRKGKDEVPNLRIFLRPKIISGSVQKVTSGYKIWMRFMEPHQDVLEIVPWDPEHVPLEHVLRWAKVEPELSMDTEGGLHGVLFKPPTFILKTSSCYPRDSVFQTQHRCGQPGMGSGEQRPLQALLSHLRSSQGSQGTAAGLPWPPEDPACASSSRNAADLWRKVRTLCQALHANNKYYFCS